MSSIRRPCQGMPRDRTDLQPGTTTMYDGRMPIADRMRPQDGADGVEGVRANAGPNDAPKGDTLTMNERNRNPQLATRAAILAARNADAKRRTIEGLASAPAYGGAAPVPTHKPTIAKHKTRTKTRTKGATISVTLTPEQVAAYMRRTARPDAELRRTSRYQPPIVNRKLCR